MAGLANVGRSTGTQEKDPTAGILKALAKTHDAISELTALGLIKDPNETPGPAPIDPQKKLDHTLSTIGMKQPASDGSDVDPAHVQEVIAQLRQMGSQQMGPTTGEPGAVPLGGQGSPTSPVGAAGTANPGGYDQSGGVMQDVGKVPPMPWAQWRASQTPPFAYDPNHPYYNQAAYEQMVSGSGGPMVQSSPDQAPVPASAGDPAAATAPGVGSIGMAPQIGAPTSVTNPSTIVSQVPTPNFPDFKVNPDGAPVPSTVTPGLQGVWQSLNDRIAKAESELAPLKDQLTKAFDSLREANANQFTDPKTGKAYQLPEPVTMARMIGGKHTIGDIATLVLGLVAAASGENGAQFALGLLQGSLGAKEKDAGAKTQQGREQFALEQQARAGKVAAAQDEVSRTLKMIGITDQEINQIATHMDRVSNQMITSDNKKANETRLAREGQALDASRAQGVYERLVKSPTSSWPAIKGALEKWKDKEPDHPEYIASEEEAKNAWLQNAVVPVVKELNSTYQTAMKGSGGQYTLTPRQEKNLQNQRMARAKLLGIDKDPELLALLPEPPASVETIANEKFGFLKGKERQQLKQGWTRLRDYETSINNARTIGEQRNAINRYNAYITASDKDYKAAFDAAKLNLESKRKATLQFPVPAGAADAYNTAKADFDEMLQNRESPMFQDQNGRDLPNLLYRPKPMALPDVTGQPAAGGGGTGGAAGTKYTPDQVNAATTEVYRQLKAKTIDEHEANRRINYIKQLAGG